MDSVQEVHFDHMLGNGVLETVEHLAPIAQRHILLVQLGTKQMHSYNDLYSLGSENRSPWPNALLLAGAGMSTIPSEDQGTWIRHSPSALPGLARENWYVLFARDA